MSATDTGGTIPILRPPFFSMSSFPVSLSDPQLLNFAPEKFPELSPEGHGFLSCIPPSHMILERIC